MMQPEPIYRCYLDIIRQSQSVPYVIYMSPQGKVLTEGRALELREYPHLLLLCGHYEGVDERILERIVDEEISIGDYVLTGGELGALVLTDAVVRLCGRFLAHPGEALAAGASIVNIASRDTRRLKDFVEELHELAGGRGELEYGTFVQAKEGALSVRPDVERLHALLPGWRERYTFRQGIRAMLEDGGAAAAIEKERDR